MHTIHVWGSMREKFGSEFTLRCISVQQGVRGLCSMVKGFGEEVAKMNFRIIIGDRDTGRLLRAEEVGAVLPVGADVHLVPAVRGAGGGGHGMGIGKIIIGTILIVASWYAGGSAGIAYFGAQGAAFVSGMAFAVGMTLIMSGISALLAPQAKQQKNSNQNSFGFSGVQNTTQQGVPVPVVYGEFEIGSVLVSAGISTQQLIPGAIYGG